MDTNRQTAAPEVIALSLIHDKAQALRERANWLEELEHDLRDAIGPDAQHIMEAVAKPHTQHDLRQVVREILLRAPDHKLKRKDIIQRVRERLGQSIVPIGVISTLARRTDFKKVEGDSFTLTKDALRELQPQPTTDKA